MAKRAKHKTPQQIADGWAAGMGTAAQAYIAGCKQPKRDPIQAATTPEASAAYLAGVQASEASGLRASRLRDVGTQGWLKGCTDKGAQNLAAAGQRRKQRYLDAVIYLAPVWDRMKQAADAVTGPKSVATATAKVSAALQVLMNAGRRGNAGVPGFGG